MIERRPHVMNDEELAKAEAARQQSATAMENKDAGAEPASAEPATVPSPETKAEGADTRSTEQESDLTQEQSKERKTDDSSRNEKLEREKLFQSQIENNAHPRAKSIKAELILFMDSIDRDSYNTSISDKFQSLKDELSEVLYRNDIEYAEDKEIKINEEDKGIVQPILDFRKEMDALNPLDPRALVDYKDRLLGYMGDTFGVESYKPKEGDMVNTRTTQVIKVHGTNVSLLDQRIKKVLGSGYKFNDEFLEYYKESQAKNNKEMKEKWNSLKNTIPDDERDKIINEDTESLKRYSFPTGYVRPAKVETYSSTAHAATAEAKVDADPMNVDRSETEEERKATIKDLQDRIKAGRVEIDKSKRKSPDASDIDGRREISDLRTELWELKVKENLDPEKIRELEDKLRALETGVEGTPKENREKLKEVVGRFENDEHVKTYKEYLGNRSEELNTEAKKSGLEGAFRWIGEKYNKLGWKSKLGVGLAFGLGAAAFTTVSMPIAFTCMSGIAAQRIAGLASSFLKYEKKGKGKEGFWVGKEGAMLKAMAYSFGMSAAIGEAVHLASESSYGEAVHEWLKHNYPFGHAEVATHHAGAHSTNDYETMKGILGQEKPKISIDEMLGHNATNAISNEQIANMSAGTMPEVSAPEIPDISVEASAGHGYEWMMKRMYEQLNDANLDPEQYPEGSDIRQLLDADDSTIDAVVHRIASNPDHGFFNADGTSVQIDHDAYMTIDADGQINLDDAIQAPEGATITPIYHPESPISEPSSVETPTTPEAPQTEASQFDQPASTETQTEAPSDQEAHAAPAETKVPEAHSIPVEHIKQFVNSHNLLIDPTQGHVFQDQSGAAIAYGNDFDARFEAAQDFAKANPGTSVWAQAEHPVLIDGNPKPFVFEVIHGGGLFGRMQILGAEGPSDLSHVGAVKPDTFIKQLDVK